MMLQSQQEQQQLAKKLANLPPEKRSILIKLLQKEGIDPSKLSIIPTNRESQYLPLSWNQERLWFLDRLEENSTNYNLLFAVRITGNLQINCLQQALKEIVQRHEVLRTNFSAFNGIPVQIIKPEGTWDLTVENFQDLQETETVIQKYIQQEQQTPFNLATDSLIRATLLQLTPNEYILLLTRHHIIWDGWSTGIFLQELSTLYQAYSQGKLSPLPKLPIQYVDFAVWQRQWLTTEVLESQLNYWKQQLANAPDLLNLPTDRPRPSVMTYRGKSQKFTITSELTQQLQKLSRESGTTLFMTLLAVFSTLLYRYSHQEDILIGSPIANRNKAEIESLIGFFVNTLVLRTKFENNPSFAGLLKQVKEVTLAAYAHQDIPFEQVVEALQSKRSLSHSPLFQVMFVLQNMSMSSLELPGVTLTPLELEKVTANFDLTLDIEPKEEGLVAEWSYNSYLFDDETIASIAGHFQNLLISIVNHPQQLVENLPLLSEKEQHQLLLRWNDTACDYPQDQCIHQLFEAQVKLAPNAIALVFEDQQITYQELNCRANQLAHYLQSLGVRPNVLVGLYLERSLEMVVGLLAILKAGGAYVPLDPSNPAQRLAYMLSDAGVPVLLTQQSLLASLPDCGVYAVCLDADWQAIAQNSALNPLCQVKSSDLAYAIYTSGSTGQPKGVQIRHQGVVNFLDSMSRSLKVTDSDVFTAVTTISFDIAALEVYLPLILGAKVVVVSRQVATDGSKLLSLLQSSGATVVQATPATWQMLLASGLSKLDSNFRALCGGEALPAQLAKQLLNTGCQLWNLYGPTETTIWSAIYKVENAIADENSVIPIGRPIANTQIYILDNSGQPVPVGVAGEVHIGGAGLAVGYLNRPELTAEKFIDTGFNKLYKTGDLARYKADGNIEYLGRIDHQVKIRGFRIELGEIEAALGQHPDIRATVVVAREDGTGDKRLVAYVVIDTSATVTTSKLRQFLKQKLPEYMVPAAFAIVETLPLNSNGKVDRKALPAPQFERGLEKTFVAPRTAIEEIIANTWSEILAVSQIGIHDNFFELGGHSLKATQIISRVQTNIGVELPLRSLFEFPTVAGLAECIEALLRQGELSKLPPILPVTTNGEISFAQQRLWFLYQLDTLSAFYNINAALRIEGTLNSAALEHSLQQIIHRHSTLRTNFITVDGQPKAVVSSGDGWKLQLVDLRSLESREQEDTVARLTIQFAQRPFNLESECLLRATLLILGETEQILLLTMHHIVSDGWSIGILVQELAALYVANINHLPSPLKQLPIQYADFAVWQRQWQQEQVFSSQLAYWQQQLQGAPTYLPLPTDRPRPAVQTFKGAHQHFKLDSFLTLELTKLSQQQGATLFMTLLTVFGTLLYRYSGQSDILIGTPIANRNRPEIEGLIGFFANTLVLRTNLQGNPSFEELLARVRETALAAYAHQDLPFELLVEALQPERTLSHTPLFQVMFILENALATGQLQLPGLTFNPLAQENQTAKFDLTLSFENTEQGLIGSWEYNTDLFDATTIERMTGHFQTLLEAIVRDQKQRVSDLPILSAKEKHQLLVESNNTVCDYPQDRCIHQLFEAQVELTPNAIALVFEDQQITYQELNVRANQLAHYLQSLGVRPNVLVGLYLERSVEMVVGLLAILKAGGAYVPLDPSNPAQRLAYMLSDAGVPVLLTQQSLLASLPDCQAYAVCLDADWQAIAENNQENPLCQVKPSDLAYVIYTSGSTGQPKGVQICHQGVANFLDSMSRSLKVTDSDIFTALTTISFDIAALEVYLPLILGAKVVVVSRQVATDGTKLLSLLQSSGTTVVQATPATWQMLLASGLSKFDPNFRALCGGEALPAQLAKQLLNTGCQLWNLYGPTETTIWSAIYKVEDAVALESCVIPIGRPIANTQIYILDGSGQPVPIGVAGEVHIGGAGLAVGYLNRPELTAEKFIESGFNNSKLYKTGDLARYKADGNIEYIGRIDHQVKIRGFRIELGEIEAALGKHPDIRATVVVVRENATGDKRLVAYVVPKTEATITTSKLRQFLKQKLPEYMVPAAFAIVETLPLNSNGKVDRKALPAPDILQENLEQGYQPPRTPQEAFLCDIYSQLLNVSTVGVNDNFFDLGGHSLLAVRLMAAIQNRFQIHLPLATLFGSPKVSQLALHLTQEVSSKSWPTLVPIQSKGNRPPLFFIPGAGGNVIYLNSLAQFLGSEQPLYGLQPKGLDGETELDDSVEKMASNYILAIKQVQKEGPYFIAGHSFGGWVAYEMGRQLLSKGEQVGLVLEVDTLSPIEINYQNPKQMQEWEWLEMTLRQASGLYGKEIEVKTEELKKLSNSQEQYSYALSKLIKANILPEGAKLSQLKGILRVYKANSQTKYTVKEESAEKLPIVLFRSQAGFTDEIEAANQEWFDREDWYWSKYSSIPVAVEWIPGDHHTMMAPPNVEILAQKIQQYIL